MTQVLPAIASPCTGICKYDADTGWCLGCARSETEIGGWGLLDPTTRAAIWDQIPGRLDQLGVTCRRLPWTTAEIRGFAQRSLASGTGTWTMGVVGAVAEFTPIPGETISVETTGDEIIARTTAAALRMTINDDVRALTFAPASTPAAQATIVLAVKRERGRLPVAPGVADQGPDTASVLTGDDGRLFDLGLGRKEARFCVRVPEGDARSALQSTLGQPLLQALPTVAPALRNDSPTRVIESALGRIEVQGRIPRPDQRSPAGSHTHLLPDHLATGRAMPAGMDLPRAYLPGAIFYDRNARQRSTLSIV